jgi:hypothetical protein
MHLLKAALRYIDAGLAPIPTWPDRRKNPHLTSTLEYQERQPTRQEWTRWAHRWPKANIGLITGYWRNLVALDFDSQEDYNAWDGLKGQTWTVATARGYHVWLELAEDPETSRMFSLDAHEVLLRAKGGYCISPPSIHHTGARYRTVHKLPPLRVDSIYDALPGWVEKQTAQQSGSDLNLVHQKTDESRLENMIAIPDRAKPNSRGAIKVHCPFHDDKTPSAWVNLVEQRFGCNVCVIGEHGKKGYWDVINVYAKLNNISNGEAYKAIAGKVK